MSDERAQLHDAPGGRPTGRTVRPGDLFIRHELRQEAGVIWCRCVLTDGTPGWLQLDGCDHDVRCVRTTSPSTVGRAGPDGAATVTQRWPAGTLLLLLAGHDAGQHAWREAADDSGRRAYVLCDDSLVTADLDTHRPLLYILKGWLIVALALVFVLLGLTTGPRPTPDVVALLLLVYGLGHVAYGKWRQRRGIGPDTEAQRMLVDLIKEQWPGLIF